MVVPFKDPTGRRRHDVNGWLSTIHHLEGEITLVIEVKAAQPEVVSPTPSSMDITIPQRAVIKSKASLKVTIPQRTPTRLSVYKSAPTGVRPGTSNLFGNLFRTGEPIFAGSGDIGPPSGWGARRRKCE